MLVRRFPVAETFFAGLMLLACSATVRDFHEGGGASSSGGGGATSASGTTTGTGGSRCTSAEDCPTLAEPCLTTACVEERCVIERMPEGTEPMQAQGDCVSLICDADGHAVAKPADDPEDDGNPCTADLCEGTRPAHRPWDGPCPGGHCEAGDCVPDMCATASDCGPPQECATMVCMNGRCLPSFTPAGSLCNGLRDQCDGMGNCIECVNNGGCDECCVCVDQTCVPA